ncbi:hypothetical protein BT93_L5548 [Corymbia citriodora subsp. variegata]|uniref:Arginine biosynthesis bifunctional protein ArgJ, chloroplastic n=1 Tax=Corymbia citriodora subsp. variegata TaxID=360336 RepID=A0A8T0CG13_CORYI|nr:hypothetical protein BT93_L5548 [Corymbia citriodora subsp. variegata]
MRCALLAMTAITGQSFRLAPAAPWRLKSTISELYVAPRRLLSCTSVRQGSVDKSKYILREDGANFPKGYKAAGVHCGIKKAGALDLALVTSTTSSPASAAACFTKNVFQAAPVQISRAVLLNKAGRARSLIVNSGCANAVTGKQGLEDAWTMSRKTDELLGGGSQETLVMSTGVIGQNLKMDKILASLPQLPGQLSDNYKGWSSASQAFMTTDTFPKLRTRSIQLGGQEVRFVGMDKGAGMIHPRMGPPGPPHATLLGLIATDAAVEPAALQTALTYAIDRSFNSISVDGDMSTNDTVVAFANGASGAKSIASESSSDFELFRNELTDFAVELAGLVVRDGEGATKFVKITVKVRVL